MRITLVPSGRISGTYSETYHKVNLDNGSIGYGLDRQPSHDEKMAIVADAQRAIAMLKKELDELEEVVRCLTN